MAIEPRNTDSQCFCMRIFGAPDTGPLACLFDNPTMREFMNYNCLIRQVLLVTLVGLSACTNSTPSAGDIKDQLVEQLTECSIMKVSDVKKIDGMAQNDGSYRVKTKFNITFTPLSENVKLRNEFHDKSAIKKPIDQEYQLANSTRRKDEEQLRHDIDAKLAAAASWEEKFAVNQGSRELWEAARARERAIDQEYYDALKAAGLSSFGVTSYLQQMRANTSGKCRITQRLGARLLFQASDAAKLLDNDAQAIDALAQSQEVHMEYELSMVKTERGWRLDL